MPVSAFRATAEVDMQNFGFSLSHFVKICRTLKFFFRFFFTGTRLWVRTFAFPYVARQVKAQFDFLIAVYAVNFIAPAQFLP